ncbi:pilus assembly protein TadG-related protein [Alsobacter soli]|nr:pilus assembly protein TadG-related protein [Alsobacter soli]
MIIPRSVFRLFQCTEASIAMLFGVMAPLVFGMGVVATDYASIYRERSTLQDAADSASLAAASELRLANPDSRRLASLAASFVASKLKGEAPRFEAGGAASSAQHSGSQSEHRTIQTPSGQIDVITTVDYDRQTLKTVLSRKVATYALRHLGAAPDQIGVESVARLMGASPLCVLSLERKENKTVAMLKGSRVTAKDCAVQSDSASADGLFADDATSQVRASKICAATAPRRSAALQVFAPTPVACPPADDPLAARAPAPFTPPCINDLRVRSGEVVTIITGPVTLCYKRIEVMSGGRVVIRGGGVIAFGAPPKGFGKLDGLIVRKGGRLETAPGDGVTFYFMNGGTFAFLSGSFVSLSAPTGGSYPGFLFIEDPAGKAKKEYFVNSLGVTKLLGTIYLKQGYLRIDLDDAASKAAVDDGDPDENDGLAPLPPGTDPSNSPNAISGGSAYTIIVVRKMEVRNKANLVMNSDYQGTSVPVPKGVGPTGGYVVVER